jgi:hypothetical protein
MTRRKFVPAAAAVAAASSVRAAAAGPSGKSQVFEFTTFHLRNSADDQRTRCVELIEKTLLPALERGGAGASACFASAIAPGGLFLITVTPYASLAALEETRARLNADAKYTSQMTTFASTPGLGFLRLDTALLRAFPGMPSLTAMAPKKSGSRVFELRTYESDNPVTLARKIKMFEQGEAAIFRRLGMEPVFFAETVFGQNMPSLVYMLAFDSLADREKAWKAFGSDPEWIKLRATPGCSDAEIVSNISSVILSPLPFSTVR